MKIQLSYCYALILSILAGAAWAENDSLSDRLQALDRKLSDNLASDLSSRPAEEVHATLAQLRGEFQIAKKEARLAGETNLSDVFRSLRRKLGALQEAVTGITAANVPPPNDNCGSAIQIGDGEFHGAIKRQILPGRH